MSQTRRTRHFELSAKGVRSARRGEEKNNYFSSRFGSREGRGEAISLGASCYRNRVKLPPVCAGFRGSCAPTCSCCRSLLAMLPLVSPPNDVYWETSAEIPYWWRVTTQIWVVLLIGRAEWEIWFNRWKSLLFTNANYAEVLRCFIQLTCSWISSRLNLIIFFTEWF